MTALARATGDGMISAHNNNSRQQKNAPPKRGKLKGSMTNATVSRLPAPAQY
jgi:hypothetical protein